MDPNMKKQYEYLIIFLALVSIALVLLDFSSVIRLSQSPWLYLDQTILIIFTVDYLARFYQAKNKLRFFYENIFDLIAIIPFNTLFSFFRFARIFRIARLSRLANLSRLVGVTGKLSKHLKGLLQTNGFINVLYASIVLIIISSALYSYAENVSYIDALWWSFVTTTTVGYGDISPDSPIGRFAAVVLMFLGIGFIGFLTSTLTEYFNKRKKESHQIAEKLDLVLEKIERLEKEVQELKEKERS